MAAAWLALAAAAVSTPAGVLQPNELTSQSTSSAVGWTQIFNGNMPIGRTASSMCTGAFGILVFGGGVHEHRFTDETWLLPALGGSWRLIATPEGRPHPRARAVAGMARYGSGCIMYGGVGRTQGTNVSFPEFDLLDETWQWTPDGGWVELTPPNTPPPRFYHTLKELSDGSLFLYGGRTSLFGTAAVSMGDTWSFRDGAWSPMNMLVEVPEAAQTPMMRRDGFNLRNTPPPRWGQAMACNLSNTGPALSNSLTGYGKVECVMFGGSQVADDDYFSDTWLLKVATDENGTVASPRAYFWDQQNSRVQPHGRWSFMMATCGSRALFLGGSTDFRVSADETWVWEPVTRVVELPDHPPSRLGEWRRLYGTDPINDGEYGSAGRPALAGPVRIAGYALANVGAVGASDIVLFGGAKNQSGGGFAHKGWETSEMWRWPCSAEEWPEAVIASPPMPPSPPPPPFFPPGEYTGGRHGVPQWYEPPEETPPPEP